MSEELFCWKTRNGVSPQGRKNVFVSGRAQDLRKHFDRIADEILKVYDCAVWHEDFLVRYTDETICSMLEKTDLFVFAVTDRLLNKNSIVIRDYLPYARDHHKPILPVKLEEIDEAAYREIFGSEPCLDLRADSPVPSELTLRLFLNTVFLNEKPKLPNQQPDPDGYEGMNDQFLCYKTRAGTSPQGKQRVFVCGLKKDIAKYLDGIAEDILSVSDCAVWYEDPEADYDDATLLSLLESMALFVFVLTGDLLSSDNQAIRVVLPFAKENCRAILPIKTDEIDGDRFNIFFDRANYLDKFKVDPTAVPYMEKLRIFLNTVLLDEEMATCVRQAFDAYIFLSYRKKDRYFAQKLIKKIHERAFCRDVAVWYDEYLTPGRNFHDSIMAVLDKCDLFTLAVTPNTLKKPNWVLEHEIPDALEANKTILVTELVKTDKTDLYEEFDALPESTDVDDEYAFTKALREALRDVDLMKKNSDPEHNLYIGLAYLLGIDTEIDHVRALELITGSAQEDCIYAISMLVKMYRTGQGVRIDYQEALKWQERETEYYRREFEAGKSDGGKYSVSLLALSEACLELGDRERTREALSRFKALLDRYPERFQPRSRFVYFHKLGNIAKDEYDHEEALHCYREALAIAEEIAETDKSMQAMQDLALAHQMPGMIYRRENKIDEALPHTLAALKILEELDAQYHTEMTARELLAAYIHLGETQLARGEYDACGESYEKGLKIAERLHAAGETPGSVRDLMVCNIKLADLAEQRGQYQDAMVYGMAAMPYAEGLYKSTKTEGAANDLMQNLKLMQNISEGTGDLRSYCFFREKYIDLYCSTFSLSPEAEPYNKAYLLNELGQKCTEAGEFRRAEGYHERALSILTEAEKQNATFDVQREIGITWYDLAVNAQKDNRKEEASVWLNNAVASQQKLFLQTQRVDICHDLCISYCLSGSFGNRAAYDQAILLWNHLYQSTGDRTYLNAMNSAQVLRDRMPDTRYQLKRVGLTEEERKLVASAVDTVGSRTASAAGHSVVQVAELVRAIALEQPVDASLYSVITQCTEGMIDLLKGSWKHRAQRKTLEKALGKLRNNPPD